MRVDLHTHTIYSDGSYTPYEVVKMASDRKLDAVAITDHDSISGVKEAFKAGEELGITVISGVEFSALFSREVHIIGYGLDYNNKAITDKIDELQVYRKKRNIAILKKLEHFGVVVSLNELGGEEFASIGRSHIAKVMVNKGYVSSINEAFDKYLGSNKKAFVKDFRMSVKDTIELINKLGGVSVLAHPGQLKLSLKQTEHFVQKLKNFGLKGIEVYYPTHNMEQTDFYYLISKKLGLIATCGSDFHGEGRISTVGCVDKEMSLDVINLLKIR